MQRTMNLGLMATIALGLGLLTPTRAALASGGQVMLRTDDGEDGEYLVLSGTGSDLFINEYRIGDYRSGDLFDPLDVICGIRIKELSRSRNAVDRITTVELRTEDLSNPGYPSLSLPAIATAVTSSDECSAPGATTRTFVFTTGIPVGPALGSAIYACAVEPLHGSGALDACGVLVDSSSPSLETARTYSNGTWSYFPHNIFVELIVFRATPIDLQFRASGSARFPGDLGAPVVYAARGNSGATITDDNVSLAITVDNNTGSSINRNLEICVDHSPIDPKKGLKRTTGLFKPIGGGPSIMNPLVFPTGRTCLKLEVTAAAVKLTIANVVNKRVVNLPTRVLVDDPALDTDARSLEGTVDVDSELHILGFRRRAGSADDNSAEGYLIPRDPVELGDALSVRFRSIDMPRVDTIVSGFEVVGGEFGGSPLTGLDAIELRIEDKILGGVPDLSPIGLIRSVGTLDGVGSASLPAGPPPSTGVFDYLNTTVSYTSPPALVPDLFVVGYFLPGDSALTSSTAIGTDSTASTFLGNSSYMLGNVAQDTFSLNSNVMMRLLLEGDRSTLDEAARTSESTPQARLRVAGEYVALDRWGRRIE